MAQSTLPAITREFNHVQIGQRADGYLNATAMCRASDTYFAQYDRLDTTKAFLAALSAEVGIPIKTTQPIEKAKCVNSHIKQIQSLIETRQGHPDTGGGTWVHPQIAYNLAMWCDPAFAVQVTEWIHDIRTKGYATAPGVELDQTSAMAALQTEMADSRKAIATLAERIDNLVTTSDSKRATQELVSVRGRWG